MYLCDITVAAQWKSLSANPGKHLLHSGTPLPVQLSLIFPLEQIRAQNMSSLPLKALET